jgi:hypothetical protein
LHAPVLLYGAGGSIEQGVGNGAQILDSGFICQSLVDALVKHFMAFSCQCLASSLVSSSKQGGVCINVRCDY